MVVGVPAGFRAYWPVLKSTLAGFGLRTPQEQSARGMTPGTCFAP
jgi:hypothetical protein